MPHPSTHPTAPTRAFSQRLRATVRTAIPAGSSAITLTGEQFESAYRAAAGAVVPDRQRVQGVFDSYTATGIGHSLKTILVTERQLIAELWPAADRRRRLVMPADAATPGNVIVEVEQCRVNLSITTLFRLINGDPATAGRDLLKRLRADADRWGEVRGVTDARWGLLLRHPDGKRLAYAEQRFIIPEAKNLVWRWQTVPVEDGDEGEDDPIALEAETPDGQLILRWYLRGGHVRRRIELDPARLVRMAVSA